ncbi:MAG: hypothetical protein L0215_20610 [Gemmataceae bacterium]|nr:hypothetical protein [Gemmataceae bacterium]
MAARKVRLLKDILVEHLEEFEFLWVQRQRVLRSPLYTMRAFAELEERIEAHVQGLLIAGDDLPALVEPGLEGDDPAAVFSSAYLLLRLQTEASGKRVIDAFLQAEGGKLQGLKQALCVGLVQALGPLQRAGESASPALAVAAWEILARQNSADKKAAALTAFLKHADPAIRTAAWRALGYSQAPLATDLYRTGVADADPSVAKEAFWTAAWHGQSWILDHVRKIAAVPGIPPWDAIYLLAILGKPSDMENMRGISNNQALGPRRFLALGAYGCPDFVQVFLEGMASKDPLSAVAAGQAFAKITGKNTESDQRVTIPPPDGREPDDFEKEFLDEVKLPDVEMARAHWKQKEAEYRKGTRWCRGQNLSQGATPALLDQLDMESRWEGYLRGKFEGKGQQGPADLEKFPQKRL